MPDDPYREPGAPVRVDPVRNPRRRRRWPMFLVWLGMGSPLAAGMLPVALLGFGVFGVGMIGMGVQRRRARKILRSAPFHVTWIDPPTALAEVNIQVARAPDDESSRQVGEALVAISDLSIAIVETRIELRGWSWKYDDQLLLAYVLDTWGRRVDTAHGIVEITVTPRSKAG